MADHASLTHSIVREYVLHMQVLLGASGEVLGIHEVPGSFLQMLKCEEVKFAMTARRWEKQTKVPLLRTHNFPLGSVDWMDTQFQEVLFECPGFRLSLPVEDYFRLLNLHYELLVTVVGAHEENAAPIRQGRWWNVRDYSVVCLGCIWLSWWTYLDSLVELHGGTKRIKSNRSTLSQVFMLWLETLSIRGAHLSRESVHSAFDLLLGFYTLFLFLAILSVLRCIGPSFVIEFWRIALWTVRVYILGIVTID